MARSKVRLDRRGIEALLKGREMTAATREAAEVVADNVKAQGHEVEGIPGDIALPVTVSMYETDRAHAVVAIAHPSGEAVQAKHGALTKAAAEAGLDFRGR
jgi:hypothetical protein